MSTAVNKHAHSAMPALAVWADPSLLDRYQELEAECWKEYEAWKTTTVD